MYNMSHFRYENKGTQWLKSRPTGPIGLAPSESPAPQHNSNHPVGAAASTSTVPVGIPMTKAAKKNQKRKEKKKQAQQETVENVTNAMQTISVANETRIPANSDGTAESAEPDKQQPVVEKKLRNLFKRLKAIDDLQERIASGELKKPEQQQLDKIARRDEVVRQIEDLQLQLESS